MQWFGQKLDTGKRYQNVHHYDGVKDIGHNNCQRPVFSLGVSQNMHKITNL